MLVTRAVQRQRWFSRGGTGCAVKELQNTLLRVDNGSAKPGSGASKRGDGNRAQPPGMQPEMTPSARCRCRCRCRRCGQSPERGQQRESLPVPPPPPRRGQPGSEPCSPPLPHGSFKQRTGHSVCLITR